MKRLFALFAVLLLTLLTACGGGETPEESTTPPAEPEETALPFSLPYYENASLHPVTGSSQTNQTLADLVCERLFELDNSFQVSGGLAQSWSVDETGLVWTICLKNARFSDGSALTGADAAASLELARNSQRYAARLADITGVSAEGNTLTITLSRPHGELPLLLDIPVTREGEDGLPLGSGYYAFTAGEEGLSLTGTQSRPDTLPASIPLVPIAEAEELIYAFDTKEVSLVVTDLTGSGALGFSDGCEVWDAPTTTMLYLGFRTDSGPCQDAALRKAISCALEREDIVNVLYARHARAALLPASPAGGKYDQALADGAEATLSHGTELLSQAGYTLENGILYQGRRGVSLKLIVNGENTFRANTADSIAEDLGRLGLNVTVEKLPWKDFTARLEAGSFDLYLAETTLTADFDLECLVGSAGTLNYGRWKNAETDALLDAFRADTSGGQAVTALYEHLLENAPIAPVCFKEQSTLTQWGQVSGLTPTRGNSFAGWAWSVS